MFIVCNPIPDRDVRDESVILVNPDHIVKVLIDYYAPGYHCLHLIDNSVVASTLLKREYVVGRVSE